MASLKGERGGRKKEENTNGQDNAMVRGDERERVSARGMVQKGDAEFATQVRVMASQMVKEDWIRNKAGRRRSEEVLGRRRREMVGSRSWEGTRQAREQMEMKYAAETKENWRIYQVLNFHVETVDFHLTFFLHLDFRAWFPWC